MNSPQENPPLKAKQSLPFIDSLRGFAALWVVLFHVRVDLWVGLQEIGAHADRYAPLDRFLALLSIPAYFGGGGVMLFFLVSGFCIHLPHVGDRDVAWRAYLARRFWRIYPPYLAAVAFTVLCESLAMRLFDSHAASSPSLILQTIFMVQNYAAAGGQLVGNPSLWSLPVEMELYLVYPVFLLLLDRLGARGSLIIAAIVSLVATVLYLMGYSGLHNNFAHYWLIWCSGAWLADCWRRNRLPSFRWWYCLLLPIAGTLACTMRLRDVSFALQNYAWAITYFMVMLIGLTRDDWVRAIPRIIAEPMARIGVFSYSVYLVHFPAFILGGAAWVWIFGSKPASLIVPLVATLLVLPIAWLFYRCTEVPSQRIGRELTRRWFSPVAVRG